MTIITRMNRGLRPNTPDGQLMFKEQNVYFLSCLKMKQPYWPYLTPEHVRFLREFGAQI